MKHLALLILIILPGIPLSAQEKKPAPSDVPTLDPTATRELIRQWVQTERLVSEEKTNWQVEKQRMQELLDLYQKELVLLDEEISKAGTSAGMVDEQKETFQKELKDYRVAQRLLSETLARLLPRVSALVLQLPQSLQDDLALESQLLTSPDALAKPREALKSVLAVMAMSGRFNRRITVVEETRTMSGGKKMTVDVIYLGLARAYYAAESGDTAGIGTPGKDGWQWQEKPELATDIRQTLAIYRKENQPQLIKLPISLTDESSK